MQKVKKRLNLDHRAATSISKSVRRNVNILFKGANTSATLKIILKKLKKIFNQPNFLKFFSVLAIFAGFY